LIIARGEQQSRVVEAASNVLGKIATEIRGDTLTLGIGSVGYYGSPAISRCISGWGG
jgi:hypothetical protein